MYLSYYVNLPSGPAIVMVVSSLFALSFLFSPRYGVLVGPRRGRPWQTLKALLPSKSSRP